jgi:hypothetical protein
VPSILEIILKYVPDDHIRGPLTQTRVFTCCQGTISVCYSAEIRDLKKVLGTDNPSKWYQEAGPDILPHLTRQVQLSVKPACKSERQISARFSAAECVAVFQGEWPNDTTFSRIAAAVREKKNYPMPEPEIPGGGGKSRTAQGQTKKPGSHSHNKHH